MAMTRRTFILCAIVAVLSVTSTAAATHALVTSKDIKNGTIQPVDLSPAAKKAMRGKAGPQGPAGPTGLQGPAGFATVADANNSIVVPPGFSFAPSVTLVMKERTVKRLIGIVAFGAVPGSMHPHGVSGIR